MERRTDTEEPGCAATQPRESQPAEPALATPAATPTTHLEPPPVTVTQPRERERAGFWVRFVAFAIDLSLLCVFSALLVLTGFLIFGMGGLDSSLPLSLSLLSLCEAATLAATAAYFTILHSEKGQTIGKNLLGLEVCTLDGEPLGYGQALIRFLAYGCSWFFFGLGFLWIGMNPGKRGWHDLLAGTMVVVSRR